MAVLKWPILTLKISLKLITNGNEFFGRFSLILTRCSGKRRYLDRMRMKPTFGTSGPFLNQDKINAIVEAESSVRVRNQGKRINVKLKDLIIFDKKIIASNVENR